MNVKSAVEKKITIVLGEKINRKYLPLKYILMIVHNFKRQIIVHVSRQSNLHARKKKQNPI